MDQQTPDPGLTRAPPSSGAILRGPHPATRVTGCFALLLVLGLPSTIGAQDEVQRLETRLATAAGSEKLTLLVELGTACLERRDSQAALDYGLQAEALARELDDAPRRVSALIIAGDAHRQRDEYASALERYKEAIALTAESSRSLAELQAQFHVEQKEHQIELLKLQQEIDALEIERHLQTRRVLAGGLVMMIALLPLFYGRYRSHAKASRTIALKNQEILRAQAERGSAQIREAELRAEAAELQARAIQAESERKEEALAKARELERAYQELETLDEIVHTINRELALETVMEVLLEQGLTLVPQAKRGTFAVFDHESQRFEVVATCGWEKNLLVGLTLTFEEALLRYTQETERLAEGVFVVRAPGTRAGAEKLRHLPPPRPEALVSIAVTLGENVEGFLIFAIFSQGWALGALDVRSLSRYRQHAISALYRARSYRTLEEKNQEVERKNEEISRTQTELLQRTTYLNSLIDGNPLAIVALDSRFDVRMVNPAFSKLFFYQEADIVGRNLDELITPQDAETEASTLTRRVLSGETIHQQVARRRRKDGSEVTVEIHGVPLIVDGRLSGVFGIYQDITERQRLAQQIIHSEKMASLGQLVAGVAHEINNPVNFISSGLPSLKRYIAELVTYVHDEKRDSRFKKIWDRQRQLIEVIEEGSRRTAEIVKNLRTFSRVGEAEIKTVDLRQALSSTLSLLHHQVKDRIQVVTRFGDLPLVECYISQLNQVFMNLLINAIQAIDGEGSLTITTALAAEDRIRISIHDTGKGMTEEIQRRIFDPFFSTKPVGQGTGLGLSISHGIIEKHGGSLSVASKPGKGAEFTITLPIRLSRAVDGGTGDVPNDAAG